MDPANTAVTPWLIVAKLKRTKELSTSYLTQKWKNKLLTFPEPFRSSDRAVLASKSRLVYRHSQEENLFAIRCLVSCDGWAWQLLADQWFPVKSVCFSLVFLTLQCETAKLTLVYWMLMGSEACKSEYISFTSLEWLESPIFAKSLNDNIALWEDMEW